MTTILRTTTLVLIISNLGLVFSDCLVPKKHLSSHDPNNYLGTWYSQYTDDSIFETKGVPRCVRSQLSVISGKKDAFMRKLEIYEPSSATPVLSQSLEMDGSPDSGIFTTQLPGDPKYGDHLDGAKCYGIVGKPNEYFASYCCKDDPTLGTIYSVGLETTSKTLDPNAFDAMMDGLYEAGIDVFKLEKVYPSICP